MLVMFWHFDEKFCHRPSYLSAHLLLASYKDSYSSPTFFFFFFEVLKKEEEERRSKEGIRPRAPSTGNLVLKEFYLLHYNA